MSQFQAEAAAGEMQQQISGQIGTHRAQGIFFKPGDLGLADVDLLGHLCLRFTFKKAQIDNMALSVRKPFNGF